ncbi:MAG: hypothetical protein E7053_09935 [Lentisphaerae bacterium]|nr:hypothetical protein [Lentisphaerota bacterium]
MIIAVNTDCVKLDPVPALERIAAAGFRHLIWCWHWNDNYLYTPEAFERCSAFAANYFPAE